MGLTVEAADDPAGVGLAFGALGLEEERMWKERRFGNRASALQIDGPALQVTPSRGLFVVLTCWRASTQDAHAA